MPNWRYRLNVLPSKLIRASKINNYWDFFFFTFLFLNFLYSAKGTTYLSQTDALLPFTLINIFPGDQISFDLDNFVDGHLKNMA